jgi:hypothetical protein
VSTGNAAPPALPRDLSDAIRIARVLCIVSMVSVHVWPGATRVLAADTPFNGFFQVMIEYLGRGSVPLLSLVSGYLLTLSAHRYSAGRLVAHKAQALLYPMAVWSALLLALLVMHAMASGDASRLPATPLAWLNAVFALTAEPVNLPLAFLRDVFVAAVLGLAGMTLCRRSVALGAAFLIATAAIEYWAGGLLTLRPQILIFFFAGVLLGVSRETRLVPPLWLVVLALAADIIVQQYFTGEVPGYLNRVAMSLVIWRCAIELARRPGALTRGIRALEPHIFIIFCSHMITVTIFAAVANALHIREQDPILPLVWLLQFPLILAVGVAISLLSNRLGIKPLLVGARA